MSLEKRQENHCDGWFELITENMIEFLVLIIVGIGTTYFGSKIITDLKPPDFKILCLVVGFLSAISIGHKTLDYIFSIPASGSVGLAIGITIAANYILKMNVGLEVFTDLIFKFYFGAAAGIIIKIRNLNK
ncbi:MAG: hypothetical protein AAB527_01200 [Patescibacteria group bacterium]